MAGESGPLRLVALQFTVKLKDRRPFFNVSAHFSREARCSRHEIDRRPYLRQLHRRFREGVQLIAESGKLLV